MAAAGFLEPGVGMVVAALLALPAIVIGGSGLPVPRSHLHFPHVLTGEELAALVRRGGPSAAALHMHRWRPKHLLRLAAGGVTSPFGLFLVGWFAFSLGVSAFGALYPVLMRKSFAVPIGAAAMLMSIATAVSIPLYNLAGRFATRHGAPIVLGVGYMVRLVTMAGMAALAYFRPDFSLWGAVVLFALFQGIWPSISVASNDLAASLAPFGEGPAMGLFNAVAAIAFGVRRGGRRCDSRSLRLLGSATIHSASNHGRTIDRPPPVIETEHGFDNIILQVSAMGGARRVRERASPTDKQLHGDLRRRGARRSR